MITTLGIVNTLYTAVVNFNLGTSLGCDPCDNVYKLERPENSITEDVVINCLPITGDTIQYCTANVNIHVPDIHVKINGKSQYKPDTFRMGELATLYGDYFNYLLLTDMEVTLENQSIIKEDLNQHYVNLRLTVRMFNN